MTTIILTMIGILLAAASVTFLVFYGGDAFFDGKIRSEAARLSVEGGQIDQAVSSFVVREGRIPGDGTQPNTAMNEVIGEKFLSEAPIGANGPWLIDYENGLIRADLGSVNDERSNKICNEARSRQNLPNPGTLYMCDGTDHPAGYLPANEPCCKF